MVDRQISVVISLILSLFLISNFFTFFYLFESTERGFELELNEYQIDYSDNSSLTFSFTISNLDNYPLSFNYICILMNNELVEYFYFQDFIIVGGTDNFEVLHNHILKYCR